VCLFLTAESPITITHCFLPMGLHGSGSVGPDAKKHTQILSFEGGKPVP